MTEQANVQEPVQMNDAQLRGANGEDASLTVDRLTIDRASSTAFSDAKRYRKRAQAAQKQVEESKAALTARDQTISEQEKALAQLHRQRKIDRALIDAGALDVDMARQLTEAAMAQASESDANAAVDELKRTKPFLFRQNSASFGSGAMSPAADGAGSPVATPLHRAASSALETGKRSDLLRYLRLRRRGA